MGWAKTELEVRVYGYPSSLGTANLRFEVRREGFRVYGVRDLSIVGHECGDQGLRFEVWG